MNKLILSALAVLTFSTLAHSDERVDPRNAMRNDAFAVCGLAGVPDDACADVIGDEYVDAMFEGARAGGKVDSSSALRVGIEYTQCEPMKSSICKAHVTNWASWYMFGQKRIKTDKVMQEELVTYFDGVN